MPGVKSCDFDGEVKSLILPGAGAIKERILLHDNSARRIEYSCFESPGALTYHHAKMEILSDGQHSLLAWEAIIEPIELEAFVKESMEGALSQLEDVLAKNRL